MGGDDGANDRESEADAVRRAGTIVGPRTNGSKIRSVRSGSTRGPVLATQMYESSLALCRWLRERRRFVVVANSVAHHVGCQLVDRHACATYRRGKQRVSAVTCFSRSSSLASASTCAATSARSHGCGVARLLELRASGSRLSRVRRLRATSARISEVIVSSSDFVGLAVDCDVDCCAHCREWSA